MFKQGDRIRRRPEVTVREWMDKSLLSPMLYDQEFVVAVAVPPEAGIMWVSHGFTSGLITRPELYRRAKENVVALEVDGE